jgi:hypothetical protein
MREFLPMFSLQSWARNQAKNIMSCFHKHPDNGSDNEPCDIFSRHYRKLQLWAPVSSQAVILCRWYDLVKQNLYVLKTEKTALRRQRLNTINF